LKFRKNELIDSDFIFIRNNKKGLSRELRPKLAISTSHEIKTPCKLSDEAIASYQIDSLDARGL
jgi:sarcosine oxidase delta subunit